MNALFRTFALFAVLFAMTASHVVAKTVTDTYKFKMTLQVPRIYDNSQSLGSRKYQKQRIRGKMHITYDTGSDGQPTITFSDLRNLKHKVNGASVTYTATEDEAVQRKVNVIGDNLAQKFHTPSVCFGEIFEPSYIWGAPDEDNSLYLTISGNGKTTTKRGARVIRKLSGSVAGAIGCGCTFYGHVSPTRVMGYLGATMTVDDVAAVFGTWSAVRSESQSR